MADEHDAGIDKQKLLDEIVGAASAPDSPAAEAVSEPPPAPGQGVAAGPPAEPPVTSASSAAATVPVLLEKPAARPKPLPAILLFRNEVAAMVLGGCGVVWTAIGLAAQAWLPGGVGLLLMALAAAVWGMEIWREE